MKFDLVSRAPRRGDLRCGDWGRISGVGWGTRDLNGEAGFNFIDQGI
jgi:hypothetical protein